MNKPKLKICCSSLDANFNNSSDATGFKIKERTDSKEAPFKITFNCLKKTEEKDFFKAISDNAIFSNMSVNGEIAIQYCPWSGTKLSSLFDDSSLK